ncbi:MAG: putative cytokinetic ring protein SteA [Actinomycetota bacterium]|nr:putative cytokinetic ring protein SteA [Actinomycetota bacterium]
MPGRTGTLRISRHSGNPFAKVDAGDIVVLNRVDLDTATARELIDLAPLAVVNARAFISGRFPNPGPLLLADDGVTLLETDAAGTRKLTEGSHVRLHDGTLYDDADRPVLSAHELTAEEISARMEAAQSGLGNQLGSFAHNATEYLRREQDLLLHGVGLPTLRTPMTGRPVVVVADGASRDDVRGMRRFLREQRPLLVGVDHGAELLLAMRMQPHVVVVGEQVLETKQGGKPRVSDRVLRQARDVVLHTSGSQAGRGPDRLERLHVPARHVSSTGNTLDIALLLAHRGGARLVIPAGAPASLEEFLEGGNRIQASTYVTRLRLGSSVVEAGVLPQLYAGRVRLWHLWLVLLAALVALGFAVNVTPRGHEWIHDVRHSIAGRL